MNENKQSQEQTQNAPAKKPFYKKWWVITIGVIFLLIVMGNSDDNKKTEEKQTPQAVQSNETNKEANPKQESENKDTSVPAEYKSALNKATSYANTMHMSKQGVYNQLVSAYGEKFSSEAAKYAIDNVKSDWNANALAKAKSYQDSMNMSPAAIRDQLISENGEKFTKAEAEYAIQHLND